MVLNFRKPGNDMQFSIRSAAAGDAEQVMLLRKRINADPGNKYPPLDPYGGDYPTVEQQRSEISDCLKNGIFLVAVNGPHMIALASCFAVNDRPGDYAVGFQVDGKWQRMGTGAALLKRVVEWASENPTAEKLICSLARSDTTAIQVCQKLGFEITRKSFVYIMQGAGYPAAEMTLKVR